MLKKTAIVLVVLLLLIAGAALYVGSNINSIVKTAIEKYGSEALGVPVTVASVNIDLVEGNGTIGGLSVANPDGYSRNAAMRFGELTLNLDYESLTIELIRAGAPEVNVELQGTASNIQALLDGMGGSEAAPADETSDPVTLRIDRIEIDAARASMSSDVLDRSVDIELPTIVLTDLEGTGDVIAAQVLRQVLSRVGVAVTRAIEAQAKDKLDDELDKLKDKAKESLLDRLRD